LQEAVAAVQGVQAEAELEVCLQEQEIQFQVVHLTQ
jgi:hypothetical protein